MISLDCRLGQTSHALLNLLQGNGIREEGIGVLPVYSKLSYWIDFEGQTLSFQPRPPSSELGPDVHSLPELPNRFSTSLSCFSPHKPACDDRQKKFPYFSLD